MNRYVGLDIGSTATKAAVIEGSRVVETWIGPSMPDMADAARRAITEVGALGLPIVTTGYGRFLYDGRIGEVSEITALAAGIEYVMPGTETVVDIGGQDSKVARVTRGRVLDFTMNDRCAAGTGRFLEAMSRVLGVPIERFDDIVSPDVQPLRITSTCTVFAETEVVGLLSRGAPVPEVLAGILAAIADRVAGLARMVGINPPLAGTGGAIRSRSLAGVLSRVLGQNIVVPKDPQTVTAIGAALLCARRFSAAP